MSTRDAPFGTDDVFRLKIQDGAKADTRYLIDVSAAGVVSDARAVAGKTDQGWESGAKVAVDRDGTPNDAHDDDEEWVVEGAMPLDALGAGSAREISLSVSRCDAPRGAARTCAAWGQGSGETTIGVLELDRGRR